MDDIWVIAIATLGSFFAGFIDAVVGGGGLLQVPLLFILFPQLAHTNVIATNRFASIGGTLVAAFSYLKKIKLNKKAVISAALFATIASVSGTYVMHNIPTSVFKPILLVIIILLAIYTFTKKSLGQNERINYKPPQLYIAFAVIGLVLGFYNGVIGPGTGTLLVFTLVQLIGLSFLNASAYAKVINVVADFASLIAFLIQGVVLFKIALPMIVTNMLGGYMGSKMAINKGNQFIRIVFLVVLTILLIRFGYDVFK